jgi:predicted nucleic acid-binding protein
VLLDSAYRGRAILALSIFNVGEAACAPDKKARGGELAGSAQSAIPLMLREVRTLARLGSLRLVPPTGRVLKDSIGVALRHHVYIADALHVASCTHARCGALYTADRELARAAGSEGLEVVLIGGRVRGAAPLGRQVAPARFGGQPSSKAAAPGGTPRPAGGAPPCKHK